MGAIWDPYGSHMGSAITGLHMGPIWQCILSSATVWKYDVLSYIRCTVHVHLPFCSDKITVVLHLKISWTGMDKILHFVISIVTLSCSLYVYNLLVCVNSDYLKIIYKCSDPVGIMDWGGVLFMSLSGFDICGAVRSSDQGA